MVNIRHERHTLSAKTCVYLPSLATGILNNWEWKVCAEAEETVVTVQTVQSSWNVMSRGDALEGKWRRNWRKKLVASTLHTTSEHGVSSITTADAHTSAASSRMNWRPSRFKWTCPFRRRTKSGFCASAIVFQTQSNPFGVRAKAQERVKHRACSIVNIEYRL
jgi:hypothetical protein